ncbi:MAG TPA: hypothetical protein VMM38_07525 [Aridibacter sp.]|nr:hypothetical protein [Aridibacter sp.]
MANELVATESSGSGPGAAVKLAGIFLIAFLLVFVFGWVWDFASEQFQRQQIEAAPSTSRTVLVIDPNIEMDLARVLSYEDSTESNVDLKDPFADRSNLGNSASNRYSALPRRDQLDPASGSRTAGPGSGPASPGGSAGSSAGSSGGSKAEEIKIDVAKETMEAVRRRESRIRAGIDPGPESVIFFIDDLLPVGMVSGGSKAPEVLMYSMTMKRTYSFPAGAVFRDGWLATWRSDGVAFGDATRDGAIFLKPWTSALDGKDDAKQVVIDGASDRGTTE